MSISVTAKRLAAGTDNAQVNNGSHQWQRLMQHTGGFLVVCNDITGQYFRPAVYVTACVTAAVH